MKISHPTEKVAVSERGPLYQYIEFCRNTETLWHKLQSGHWDWLGRKPDGQFVLGRPRREPESSVGVLSVMNTEPGAKEGQYGVKLYGWNGQPNLQPSCEWFTDTVKAKARFNEQVASLEDPQRSPTLARVILIEEGQVSDERFIAQVPPPNYQ
jgi:hypothetical protein